MSWLLLAQILLSVSLSAVAQIILKTGMSSPPLVSAISSGSTFNVVWQAAGSPWVIGGLGLYFLGAVVWLFVLGKVDVSYAYPFVGVGFILTLILGKLIMGDTVDASRFLGTLLVTAGVILIARS